MMLCAFVDVHCYAIVTLCGPSYPIPCHILQPPLHIATHPLSLSPRPTIRLSVEAQAAAAYGASPSHGNVYVNPVTHTPSRGAAKPRVSKLT